MRFFSYLFHDQKDNVRAFLLSACFFMFYLSMNVPFLTYMNQNITVLAPISPFYGDPSVYQFDFFSFGLFIGIFQGKLLLRGGSIDHERARRCNGLLLPAQGME